MKVAFIKNLPNALLPTKATPDSAAYDLYAAAIHYDKGMDHLVVDTGISTAFDPEAVMLVFGRSGLAMKAGIRLANSVGVIDSDYRGPIKIILRSDFAVGPSFASLVKPGDRVAQAIFMPIISAEFIEYVGRDLPASVRGVGGFGSSGQ